MLSLEYAESTLISDDTLQLVRHCARLGHWQPDPVATDAPDPAPPPGFANPDRQRLLPRPCCAGPWGLSGRSPGWIGEFQPAARISGSFPAAWVDGMLPSSNPCPWTLARAGRSSSTGQSLYVEDLALRYPQSSQLLALDAKAYLGIPFLGPNGVPPQAAHPAARHPLADPMPPAGRPLRTARAAASELQRLANDDALRLAEVAFNTHDGLLVMDHGASSSRSRLLQLHHRLCQRGDAGLHIDALRPTLLWRHPRRR